MSRLVSLNYRDKRLNKWYTADEIYAPESWNEDKIRQWYYERHHGYVDSPTDKDIIILVNKIVD